MADAQPTGVQKYLQAISTYEKEFERWQKRATKIIKRYRDDMRTQSGNETVKFNILWSNVQTLIPAVYAKLPKASAARRFGDNDQVGRVAAQLIERALDYEIEHYPDFRATMRYAVEDRFLGGRGVAWVRYDPHVRAQELGMPEDGPQITEDVDEDGNLPEPAGVPEEIEYECAPVDYVHWKDFGHSSARTWEEVTQVWRWVYMTREALVERFGEEMGRKIPLDSGPDNLDGPNKQREGTRAKICELWDRETQKVYWINKGMAQFVDERDDPLRLLRLVRLHAELGLDVEAGTADLARRDAALAVEAAGERQRMELDRMLTSRDPVDALRLMDDLGLLTAVLPEVAALAGVEQNRIYVEERENVVHGPRLLQRQDVGQSRRFDATAGWRMVRTESRKFAGVPPT